MKHNKTFKLVALLFLMISYNSCVEDDDYSIPTSVGLEENDKLTVLLNQINNNENKYIVNFRALEIKLFIT